MIASTGLQPEPCLRERGCDCSSTCHLTNSRRSPIGRTVPHRESSTSEVALNLVPATRASTTGVPARNGIQNALGRATVLARHVKRLFKEGEDRMLTMP